MNKGHWRGAGTPWAEVAGEELVPPIPPVFLQILGIDRAWLNNALHGLCYARDGAMENQEGFVQSPDLSVTGPGRYAPLSALAGPRFARSSNGSS